MGLESSGDERYARIPYSHGSPNNNNKRPYLVLELTGPSGVKRRIHGLVDTGADSSVLPWEAAELLGYFADSLETTSIQQLTGSVEVARAGEPSTACLPHAPQDVFPISPMFVKGCETVLWGRLDLMNRFHVSFREQERVLLIGPFSTPPPEQKAEDAVMEVTARSVPGAP